MRTLVLLLPLVVTLPVYAQYPGAGRSAPFYSPYGNASGSPSSPTTISEGMLQAHNAVRSRVGVPPLIWSDQLAKVAQEWANHLLATHTFEHRPNDQFGENYTQVVWAKTRAVGCAVAADQSQEVWVCNYAPPGNYVGYRPY